MTKAGGPLPAIFLSHGAPTLVMEDIPARDFIAGLGAALPRPGAILCISAHWETPEPAVSGAARPETIHDFYGFPDALYRLTYPAPGAPELARRVKELIPEAAIDPGQGLDHGAWNPLMLLYPAADIPVAQLSVQVAGGPEWHLDLGQRLAPLAGEGVLILASGGAVHNLRQFQVDSRKPADWAIAFDDWLAERIVTGDVEALVDYRRLKPEGRIAHPREEHFLPLFVALGAGVAGKSKGKGRPLHRSFAHGSISMAAFAWD
jgi:4,5-DOPA dioxygenase extradiol